MSEFSQAAKSRFRAQQQQNMTFKSSIFERRDLQVPSPKNLQQTKNQLLNPQSGSYFSNFSSQSNSKQQNNKTGSRQMFSSSMFAVQGKSSGGGGLFQMARMVQQTNDDTHLQSEKEKNKYSFLQVPKLNSVNSPQVINSDFKAMGSSTIYKQNSLKTPSFLKKDTKSNVDPNEEHPQGSFKKPQFSKSSSKKTETDNKYQISDKKPPQSQTNTPDNFSPLLQKTKLSTNSPMNSSDSKNPSTKQPKQSSSNNTLLDPKMIPSKGGIKGSFIFQNDKQFYTPTQKNSVKLGSANFIQIAEKYNSTYGGTLKSDNRSQFLGVHDQDKTHGLSPVNKDGQKTKVLIPSFIKFKEKRNQITKKDSINSKTFINPNAFQSQQTQRKFNVNDFEFKDRLGKGAFGDVYLVRQKQTGFFCVFKKLSKKKIKEQNTQQLIMREIKIQSFLVHRHITNMYGFFDDEEFIYLVMEYMSDGSVAQKFNRKKVQQKQVALIVKQICDALKYMHIQNIIHRDIKPDNVFIHEDYIKLGDFGCSVFSDSKRNTMVGSLAYFSPEQLNNQSYDEKIDVWSVGILCYQLLTGRSPFEEDIMKIARQEKQAKLSELRFPTKLQLSDQAKDFTRRLLQQMPENRLSIMETLKHPFIMKNNLAESLMIFPELG